MKADHRVLDMDLFGASAVIPVVFREGTIWQP